MGRLLLACVLGCAVFVVVAWQLGYIGQEDSVTTITRPGTRTVTVRNLGQSLYAPAALPKPTRALPQRKVDPVVVQGNIAVINQSDIATQTPGQILFIGEEIPEGAAQVVGVAAFLAEPFNFTKVNHGLRDVVKFYRKLKEGDVVAAEQVLAMIDPSRALGDLEMKHAKVIASEFEYMGAKAIAAEAENKFEAAQRAYDRKAIPLEDYNNALLTKIKMSYDSTAKYKNWEMSKAEVTNAQIIYKQHKILNRNPGARSVIQKIHKQIGEAVREQEPVMQLYALDRLLAETQIDAHYGNRLYDGMRVTIEPSLEDSPPKIYRGHVQAVNCLAVTHDAANPLIVSGGEDRVVFVWGRFLPSWEREFKHPEPVKALAVTPRGAPGNLILTGCADGSIRLFDLNVKDKALIKENREQHNLAVTALAFSPSGKYFASGAADGSIVLWDTGKFEKLYVFDENPHHGAITALHFTPQSKLVSASLDESINVWSLREKGAALDYALAGRNGGVGQVDVSSDGRWLLFDQGKTLQIRSVEDDGRVVNTLQNPGGVIPFATLALFSPDASLLLTAGASDGRLQLWHLPAEGERGFEVRQFATLERLNVSCAAFAPLPDYDGEGSFAVSANKDGQIYLWPLPSREEVSHHQIRNVRVYQATPGLNPSTRQRNIGFDVPNPPTEKHPKGRLEPGRQVTVVIP